MFKMAVVQASSALAIRSSNGVQVWASSNERTTYYQKGEFLREDTKNSRAMSFSPDGVYFSYTNGLEVVVIQTNNWRVQWTFPRPKACFLKFSSRGNYLSTWEQITTSKNQSDEDKNLHIFDLKSGFEVFSAIQKKTFEWEPSWSSDESIFSIVVGAEALFFLLSKGNEGFKSPVRRIRVGGGATSLGPGISPPYIIFYTPGNKGGPSMCKLYKYPSLAHTEIVASRSFFQSDQVKILWNETGTCSLILTSTEVDKSGKSYYGNQSLYFMSAKGSSCSVPLSKDGPVHCVKWSPKATEFAVVYGFMPSKVVLYNLKCDVVFNFGDGSRNCAYFNSFGNLLVLAGFGNLFGNVEIWDLKKREKVTTLKAADTTYFEWNPNGEIFLTATTAPRLRIGNGFKVWHYSGALLHETIWPEGQQLLGLEWQHFTEHTFTENPLTNMKVHSIKSSQPEASTQIYQPPNERLLKKGKISTCYVPQQSTVIRKVHAGNPAKKETLKFTRSDKPNRKDEQSLKSNITEYEHQNLQLTLVNNVENRSNENTKVGVTEKKLRLVGKKTV